MSNTRAEAMVSMPERLFRGFESELLALREQNAKPYAELVALREENAKLKYAVEQWKAEEPQWGETQLLRKVAEAAREYWDHPSEMMCDRTLAALATWDEFRNG